MQPMGRLGRDDAAEEGTCSGVHSCMGFLESIPGKQAMSIREWPGQLSSTGVSRRQNDVNAAAKKLLHLAGSCLPNTCDSTGKEAELKRASLQMEELLCGAVNRLAEAAAEPLVQVSTRASLQPHSLIQPKCPSAQASAAPLWSAQRCLHLCGKDDEANFMSKVRCSGSIHISFSLRTAVDSLNQGSLPCPEGFCIIYTTSSPAYCLLYRQGMRAAALDRFGLRETQTGTLMIQIVSASSLSSFGSAHPEDSFTDRDAAGPHVVAHFGSESQKTEAGSHAVNPTWKPCWLSFHFEDLSKCLHGLVLEVVENRDTRREALLGRMHIDFLRMEHGEPVRWQGKLTDAPCVGSNAELEVQLVLQPNIEVAPHSGRSTPHICTDISAPVKLNHEGEKFPSGQASGTRVAAELGMELQVAKAKLGMDSQRSNFSTTASDAADAILTKFLAETSPSCASRSPEPRFEATHFRASSDPKYMGGLMSASASAELTSASHLFPWQSSWPPSSGQASIECLPDNEDLGWLLGRPSGAHAGTALTVHSDFRWKDDVQADFSAAHPLSPQKPPGAHVQSRFEFGMGNLHNESHTAPGVGQNAAQTDHTSDRNTCENPDRVKRDVLCMLGVIQMCAAAPKPAHVSELKGSMQIQVLAQGIVSNIIGRTSDARLESLVSRRHRQAEAACLHILTLTWSLLPQLEALSLQRSQDATAIALGANAHRCLTALAEAVFCKLGEAHGESESFAEDSLRTCSALQGILGELVLDTTTQSTPSAQPQAVVMVSSAGDASRPTMPSWSAPAQASSQAPKQVGVQRERVFALEAVETEAEGTEVAAERGRSSVVPRRLETQTLAKPAATHMPPVPSVPPPGPNSTSPLADDCLPQTGIQEPHATKEAPPTPASLARQLAGILRKGAGMLCLAEGEVRVAASHIASTVSAQCLAPAAIGVDRSEVRNASHYITTLARHLLPVAEVMEVDERCRYIQVLRQCLEVLTDSTFARLSSGPGQPEGPEWAAERRRTLSVLEELFLECGQGLSGVGNPSESHCGSAAIIGTSTLSREEDLRAAALRETQEEAILSADRDMANLTSHEKAVMVNLPIAIDQTVEAITIAVQESNGPGVQADRFIDHIGKAIASDVLRCSLPEVGSENEESLKRLQRSALEESNVQVALLYVRVLAWSLLPRLESVSAAVLRDEVAVDTLFEPPPRPLVSVQVVEVARKCLGRLTDAVLTGLASSEDAYDMTLHGRQVLLLQTRSSVDTMLLKSLNTNLHNSRFSNSGCCMAASSSDLFNSVNTVTTSKTGSCSNFEVARSSCTTFCMSSTDVKQHPSVDDKFHGNLEKQTLERSDSVDCGLPREATIYPQRQQQHTLDKSVPEMLSRSKATSNFQVPVSRDEATLTMAGLGSDTEQMAGLVVDLLTGPTPALGAVRDKVEALSAAITTRVLANALSCGSAAGAMAGEQSQGAEHHVLASAATSYISALTDQVVKRLAVRETIASECAWQDGLEASCASQVAEVTRCGLRALLAAICVSLAEAAGEDADIRSLHEQSCVDLYAALACRDRLDSTKCDMNSQGSQPFNDLSDLMTSLKGGTGLMNNTPQSFRDVHAHLSRIFDERASAASARCPAPPPAPATAVGQLPGHAEALPTAAPAPNWKVKQCPPPPLTLPTALPVQVGSATVMPPISPRVLPPVLTPAAHPALSPRCTTATVANPALSPGVPYKAPGPAVSVRPPTGQTSSRLGTTKVVSPQSHLQQPSNLMHPTEAVSPTETRPMSARAKAAFESRAVPSHMVRGPQRQRSQSPQMTVLNVPSTTAAPVQGLRMAAAAQVPIARGGHSSAPVPKRFLSCSPTRASYAPAHPGRSSTQVHGANGSGVADAVPMVSSRGLTGTRAASCSRAASASGAMGACKPVVPGPALSARGPASSRGTSQPAAPLPMSRHGMANTTVKLSQNVTVGHPSLSASLQELPLSARPASRQGPTLQEGPARARPLSSGPAHERCRGIPRPRSADASRGTKASEPQVGKS